MILVESRVQVKPRRRMRRQRRYSRRSRRTGFEDLPGKWQAAILEAEQNRPRLRVVTGD
jgi:hypothetical protein